MPASSPALPFRSLALLVAGAGLLAGCYTVLPERAPLPPPTYTHATADSVDVPFRTLQGPFPFAPSADPATLVLRSWADVRALPPAPPVAYGRPQPSDFIGVDFDAEMVLVVAAGGRSGSTQIRIDSVLAEPDRLVAFAAVYTPCRTTRDLRYPLHAVALRADPRPVEFADLNEVQLPCGDRRAD